jgi:hypothetical protein
MKLYYRGIAYDYTPPEVNTTNTSLAGTYRGAKHYFQQAVVPEATTSHELSYRGVAYCTGETTQAPVAPQQPQSSIESLARSLMMTRHNWIKNREQSLLARSGAEIGLVEASHYWSQIQGKINPGFRVSYDRSRATFS